MTNRITHRRIALTAIAGAFTALLVGVVPFTPAHARAAARTEGTWSDATLPPEVHAGSVAYRSGGVSYEEADLMKSHLHDYPLAIELVEKPKTGTRDWYTANAHVVVSKQGGAKVLDVRSRGPFMLVRLAPGTYEVDAMLGKHILHKKHVVVKNGQTAQATFIFPPGTN